VPNKTCPAFQSYFILNDEVRKEKFSKFNSDSLPKFNYGLERNQFGILKKVSYQKRLKEWNNIDMEIVMPNLEDELDSVLIAQELYDKSDTTLSLENETPQSLRRRDHYNEDQLQYMRLFGKYLRKPLKNGELDSGSGLDELPDNGELDKPEKKKGLFGFLKKKKRKDKSLDLSEDGEDTPKKKKKKKDKKTEEEQNTEDKDISDTNF